MGGRYGPVVERRLDSVDQEGGGIGHLARAGAPDTPGALDDPAVTVSAARTLATHLAALGATVSYSPSVDVQLEPRNPIVRTRLCLLSTALTFGRRR